MVLFWVIGGKYSETRLQETVGSNEELIGPLPMPPDLERTYKRYL